MVARVCAGRPPRASALGARTVLGAIVVLHLIALLAPPLLTTDVFSYVPYGRLGALHGIDPYVAAPIRVPHDAIYPWVGWRHARSAYGPLFTVLTYPLAGIGVAPAVWSLKLVAALSSLGCVALVWRTAVVRRIDPVRAAALVGAHPVLLIWVVGGAHNDLLMMLAMSGAVCSSRRAARRRRRRHGRRRRRGEGVGGADPAVPRARGGAPRAGDHGSGDRGRGRRSGRRARLRRTRRRVRRCARRAAADRLRHERADDARALRRAGRRRRAGPAHRRPSPGAVALLALVVATGRGLDWLEGAALALVVAAAASGWLMPWYAVWALPLAVLAPRRRALVAVFALQGLVLAHVLVATA